MIPSLSSATCIVLKIGSALLVDRQTGLRKAWLESIAEDIAALMSEGQDIIIVSSGAVALGSHDLGLTQRPSELSGAQAAACVGQIRLLNAYQDAFAPYHKKIGQLLITLPDLDGRRTYLNARDTLETLLESGILPIINENDATATAGIRVGDNDRLAARVAQMIDADLLILLSDVDGLYSANPVKVENATHFPVVDEITPAIMAYADGISDTAMSRGGMRTKLEAGRIASDAGCAMIVMNGKERNPLQRLADGERHTLFKADAAGKLNAKNIWLSGQLGQQGEVHVDDGALAALNRGKSLLPAGILAVRGEFSRGDVVTICSKAGDKVARGMITYDSTEVLQIKGLKSDDIAGQLGYSRSPTVIHRDNMVLLTPMDDKA